MATANLRRTALYDRHRALDARMVPFAGFEMPLQYAGILREHDAVRHRAGLFDLSHMAQFELRGASVPAWADRLTVNAVGTMKPLQARYNVLCNERGGAHDDVIFYRLPDRWLLVANAANAAKDWALLEAADADGEVQLDNLHGTRALIAIQGPRSVEILAPHVDAEIAALKYYRCLEARVFGRAAIIARTGYTGEDGFELFIDGEAAPAVWETLLVRGRTAGLEPAGLGARDMLRLEAGMPLYGHELDEEISPLQAGLRWAVKFDKGPFVGREALLAQRERDDWPRIAGVILAGRVPARPGYPVFTLDGEPVGEVRSGSLAPSVGNRNIATVLVEKDAAEPGRRLEIEIRGVRHAAEVVALPFYKRATPASDRDEPSPR